VFWLEIIGWLAVFVWAVVFFPAIYGVMFPRFLRDFVPASGVNLPKVSVIVPARDEAEAIEESIERLLSLDYPHFEIIAINDRSSDGTGDILDRLAGRVGSRLQVVHINELPEGWLGKNHAMSVGSEGANGDFFLFTDGDVMFDSMTLRRAMSGVQSRSLDHLVILPETTTTTFLETALMNFFCLVLMAATRFPLVRWRWFKDAYLGVGAFNLVRRTAFESIGRFSKLKLEVADDVMLGRLIKHSGFHQDVYGGQGNVKVKWQKGGVWPIVRGLEKNAFAGADYSIAKTVFACVMMIALLVAPIITLICQTAIWPSLFLVVGMTLLSVATANTVGFPLTVGLLYPWAAIMFCFIVIRSMLITLNQKGVRWRETFYSLDQLRNGRTR